ncbi:MAG: ribosome biogenesis factor YjgA [Gammaproteobacteria bacterium]|nr:ribosome biogenesis factor YjgA [Gammaproteobacteria bacterium]
MGKVKARKAAAELEALQQNLPAEEELSRTQIKRAMEALQALGSKLVDLKPSELARIPMSDTLQTAIEESRRINQNEAKRRHLQYIGKVMRDEDSESIAKALAVLDSGSDEHRRTFHQLETWRDGLIANNPDTLNEIVALHHEADRQHINHLVKQAQSLNQEAKAKSATKKLFKYLRQLADV